MTTIRPMITSTLRNRTLTHMASASTATSTATATADTVTLIRH